VTAALLLAWIVAALLLQLGVGLAVAWLRRTGTQATASPAPAANAPSPAASAWPGWREFRVARREFEDAGQTQCSFYLVPTDGAALPAFRPGQFLTFALQLADPSATPPDRQRSVIRCYSLSDPPNPGHYRVTIKRVPAPENRAGAPPGRASKHFHDQVQVGSVLQVKAPAGHFCIDADARVPAVFVAAGIGITPLLSMLSWCLSTQPARPLHLYYGVRDAKVHAFKVQLEAWARCRPQLRLHVSYSRAGTDDVAGRDFQHAGHVDIELLRRALPHGRHQFYLCGPAPMMESLVPALAAWGVPQGDVHHEAFGPASVRVATPRPAAAAPAVQDLEVRFQHSGRTLVWDGQDASLLDFAERHAVAIDSGCRSGGCGTCETRVLDGEVRYANPPDHDVAPGHCLLCVGTPASPLVLAA
jgi:uncharacterized protein